MAVNRVAMHVHRLCQSLASQCLSIACPGRLFRERKASISAELAEIFERLVRNAQSWQFRSRSFAGIGCWADSSRPAARSGAKSANA
jgi:hypothetical protein